jgi:hypothetical protein
VIGKESAAIKKLVRLGKNQEQLHLNQTKELHSQKLGLSQATLSHELTDLHEAIQGLGIGSKADIDPVGLQMEKNANRNSGAIM